MNELALLPDEESSDECGGMTESLENLREAVIGRRIVSAYQEEHDPGITLVLDNGTKAELSAISDCCAYTEVEAFLLHPELVDHVITGVTTEGGYTLWHIFADMGDVLTLTIGWSEGNPCYYGYGFYIQVVPE